MVVRIDVDYVDDMTEELSYDIEDEKLKLEEDIGYEINYNSTKQLASLFDELGLTYSYKPPTDLMKKKGKIQGNPSITKD